VDTERSLPFHYSRQLSRTSNHDFSDTPLNQLFQEQQPSNFQRNTIPPLAINCAINWLVGYWWRRSGYCKKSTFQFISFEKPPSSSGRRRPLHKNQHTTASPAPLPPLLPTPPPLPRRRSCQHRRRCRCRCRCRHRHRNPLRDTAAATSAGPFVRSPRIQSSRITHPRNRVTSPIQVKK